MQGTIPQKLRLTSTKLVILILGSNWRDVKRSDHTYKTEQHRENLEGK